MLQKCRCQLVDVLPGGFRAEADPAAVFLSRPMADSTWLTRPRWQAEPAEMQIPFPLSSLTIFWLG